MANKTISNRQKLSFRILPAQKILKPRNPVAIAAKQRAAGSHQKTASATRQVQKRMVKKLIGNPESGQ
jgi:hypothetical protein